MKIPVQNGLENFKKCLITTDSSGSTNLDYKGYENLEMKRSV